MRNLKNSAAAAAAAAVAAAAAAACVLAPAAGLIVIGATVCLLAPAAMAQQVGHAPIAIEVSAPPSAMTALGRTQLLYEVRLTNFGAEPLAITQLDALDQANTLLGSWKDAQLAQRLGRIGAAPVAPPQNLLEVLRIAPGETKIAYLMLALNTGSIKPVTIHHTAIVRSSTRADTISAMPVHTTSLVVPSLESPVGTGTWVAIRGPSNSSGHRLSLVIQHGRATIPQRYAVDWAKLGEDGRLFHGDSAKLENWYGYGTPVTAVATGTVVWSSDGVAERAPFSYTAPAVIEADRAVGNSVILDIGGGAFATYAHMKTGSVRVKVGDRVTTGQQLGELGNSGNSLGPHLHFHVSDAPGPLEGEGLPFAIPSFELLGRINSSATLLAGQPWAATATQPARVVTGETPLENMVVRFRK